MSIVWLERSHKRPAAALTRTLDKVRTEMSPHVLAYNVKWMIAIMGVGPLLQVIRA